MSEWRSATVAELQAVKVLLVEDGNHGEYRPRPSEFEPGGTAFIRAADLSDGRVRFGEAGTINDVALARIRKGVGQPGDILFSHKGTIGKLARVEPEAPPFVCSPQTTFWRVLDQQVLEPAYLYAFMRTRCFIDQWWVRKGETDMADYVSLTAQRHLRIVLPPVEVQRRIAAPLRAIDDLIENNRWRIALLERMAQAIYREWFVHFRYPGHEDDELIDSPLGPIPAGWETSDVGSETLNFDRLRKPLSRRERLERPGRFPYYGAARVIDSIDNYLFDGDYLLVAEDGSVVTEAGFPILQRVRGQFWVSNHAHVLQGAGRVTTTFLELALEEYPIMGHVTGAAQPKVTQENLNRIRLLVPAPNVITAFSDVVEAVVDEQFVLAARCAVLEQIRDALLPKLVTGAIDVSHLDLDALLEEPAA
ncbi:MAG: restriction endonuclease subunit S [Actinomycetota bacterium]|nr:restriction endonuclease subunit S [Actinomycetota bacterium]